MPGGANSLTMDPDFHRIWAMNRHLRAAVDQVDEGVLILEIEPQGGAGPRVVFVNRGVCELTGYRGEDLLGCPLALVFGVEKLALLLDRLPAIAGSRGVFNVKNPLVLADESERAADWKVCCVCEDDGKPLNFMLTVGLVPEGGPGVPPEAPSIREGRPPITGNANEADASGDSEIEVRVIEGASMGTNGDAQMRSARMETLALLAGGIAHDFKNILTPIIANLSLVRKALPEGELRGKLEDAAKASESGCRMAEQLLAFARGRDEGDRIEADIGRLLIEAARLSTYGANARCDVTVGEGLWSSVVNITQVTQVINNLIINARQAMGDVGTFQAKLTNTVLGPGEVEGLEQGNYLRLDVIDHGCGIPTGKIDDIFTAFYSTKSEGNGLGLATCQTIVREHGGLVTVESEEGKGSSFAVFLPATGETIEPVGDEGDSEVYDGVGAVLVVDDQQPILTVASALLEQLGYDVDCASSGEEGIAKFRRGRSDGRPFDAVLMDMTLPGGIDGDEATAKIMEIDPQAKVIASSGYLDDTMSPEQRGVGFVGVLSKPYDLEKVSRVLHEVLTGDGLVN